MTADAVDHLAESSGQHIDLLRALTDEQLDEQMAWYRYERAAAKNPRDAHGFSRLLSTAYIVHGERHENETP